MAWTIRSRRRLRRRGSGISVWGLPLALGLVSLTLCGDVRGAVAAPTTPAVPPSRDECYRVEFERFAFYSDPWINLHHFLFQWARNVPERSPGDHRRAVDVAEAAQIGELAQAESGLWQRAVRFYRERLIDDDLLFARGLVELRGQLAAFECSAAGGEIGDVDLQTVLEEAMPSYRRHWWGGHDAGNWAWIAEQKDQLDSYGPILARRLAEAYGGEWPSQRIRVDVVAYANWAGSYTTNHPDQITISSIGHAGLNGLEILFHEASHASFFEQRLFGQVAEAFRPYGMKPPDRLVHVIQFITPAEILRSLLNDEESEDFQSVAEQVYENGSYRDTYRLVLTHWKLYLDGSLGRAEALDRIAAEIAQ